MGFQNFQLPKSIFPTFGGENRMWNFRGSGSGYKYKYKQHLLLALHRVPCEHWFLQAGPS